MPRRAPRVSVSSVRARFCPVLALALCLFPLVLTAAACEDLTADISSTAATILETETTSATASTTRSSVAEDPDTSQVPPPPTTEQPPGATTTLAMVFEPSPDMTVEVQPLQPSWTRFEETDPHLSFSPLWRNDLVPFTAFYTDSAAAVTVRFQGTRIAFVTYKLPNSGIARLRLDGSETLVDLYADPGQDSARVWTSPVLAAGSHTLEIVWTGMRNPASTSARIAFDAVDVIGSLTY